MILNKIENIEQLPGLPDGFKAGFDFLMREGLSEMPSGTYDISGRDVYAMISRGNGKKTGAARLEAHRKYADIQFLISGSELIGWKARSDCKSVDAEYLPEKDIEFYSDQPQTYLRLTPGSFAVFFPNDCHAPMISEGEVHKVVIKVNIEQ